MYHNLFYGQTVAFISNILPLRCPRFPPLEMPLETNSAAAYRGQYWQLAKTSRGCSHKTRRVGLLSLCETSWNSSVIPRKESWASLSDAQHTANHSWHFQEWRNFLLADVLSEELVATDSTELSKQHALGQSSGSFSYTTAETKNWIPLTRGFLASAKGKWATWFRTILA